ncbi:MAG TPA: hypothetical protein DCR93_08550, partial [Cytophagales bacterium]|nr:hypothetical protein [Cytophagales bacterium]HAP59535.1 hypothetical protein [Cytophagales bacterium]
MRKLALINHGLWWCLDQIRLGAEATASRFATYFRSVDGGITNAQVQTLFDRVETITDAFPDPQRLVNLTEGGFSPDWLENLLAGGVTPTQINKVFDDLLVGLTEGKTQVLAQLSKLDPLQFANLAESLDASKVAFFKARPELLTPWRLLGNAGRSSLQNSEELLGKIQKVMTNPRFQYFYPISTAKRNINSAEDMMAQIIQLQTEAGNLVGGRMSSMEDLMDNLDFFLTNHAAKPG